jgi:DmsE family decaheme c-type cytochrome
MRKRDAVLVLPVLLAVVLLAGWSCSRFASPPSGTEGLLAQAPSATKTDATKSQWTGPAPDAKYAGTEACLECHKASDDPFHGSVMGKVFSKNPRTSEERKNCESCHGPGSLHVDAAGEAVETIITFRKDAEPVEVQNAKCMGACHTKDVKRMFWESGVHESHGVSCTDCHSTHRPQTTKAILTKPTVTETCNACHVEMKRHLYERSTHPVKEGKMSCTSCHNPHGSQAPAMMVANSINDTCYKCHAEFRSPVLWEHAPVKENCNNCHAPHGSNHDKLLRTTIFRLCQSCHMQGRHQTIAGGPDRFFMINRGCADCHNRIHGSNHPSGPLFFR